MAKSSKKKSVKKVTKKAPAKKAAPAPVAVVAVPQTLFTEPTSTESNPTA